MTRYVKLLLPMAAVVVAVFVYFLGTSLNQGKHRQRSDANRTHLVTDQSNNSEKGDGKMSNQLDGLQEVYLAGGCFWGVEGYFARIAGVKTVTSGYANGETESTSYQQLAQTNHAEAVHITYDEKQVSLRELLLYYFRVVNPVSVNQQGNDIGPQYRSAIYYLDEDQKEIIETFIAEKQPEYSQPIAIEVEPLAHYILAEDYHQDYLAKNPNGYCHIDLKQADQPVVDSAK